MSGLGAAVRRHRATVAANLALVMAVSGVVFYAVQADGFKSHRTELNDGGIWITNSREGFFGRLNKPIGQQDAGLFAGLNSTVDIVQDGAAVVGVNWSTGQLSAIDPATVRQPEQESAGIATASRVQLAGGTLAVLQPATGAIRATRVDSVQAATGIAAVDSQRDPLATAGGSADLAVTTSGTVLAVSADTDTLLRIRARGGRLAPAVTTALPTPLEGTPAVTAVGETPVMLDLDSGALTAIGAARAVVEPGAELQQPGAEADSVLLATSSALLTVDLGTGALDIVAGGLSGRPAQPVRLGGCVYGAWSGPTGTVVTRCGDEEPQIAYLPTGSADLVFRVNRGQILLNDRLTGAAWNLETDQPTRLDDWESFTQQDPKPDKDSDDDNNRPGDRRPPRAKPDTFGARPGRTTLLHPLDNDSAPSGRVLSIRSIQDLSNAAADISIGPDGQTLALRLPNDAPRALSFEYYIDDGRDVSAHAQVKVTTRTPAQNRPPRLRRGFRPHTWTVPAGGAITVPVLVDWRDPGDGDPVSLVSAEVTGSAEREATVRTTTAGSVRLTAPPEGGTVSVRYAVSDGLSTPVDSRVTFRVQDPAEEQGVAPVTHPDVVSVEAGGTVTIEPLANDMPGSDPSNPDAHLALVSRVPSVAGATLRTDLTEGRVVFRAAKPKTYFLSYDAAYGNAPIARGRIRVDVRPRQSQQPIAMPDTTTIYGQAPTLVDVLANDIDPSGGLLVVRNVRPLDSDQVETAIVDGRWLRISARQGELSPSPQVVRYVVGSGSRAAVGEVTVMWRPVPEDNAPVTEVDEVTVRAGASVVVPVLDNDYSPSGDPLALQRDVVTGRAGELPVEAADAIGAPGRAFVSGRLVRYVAPADLDEGAVVSVPYVAVNSAQQSAPGRLEVTVIPAARANRPPEPSLLQGRVVAGATLKLSVPGAGVDPDGDSVSLVGLSSAPRLGRLVSFGANSMEYQAYPDSAGTEQFSYTLTDSVGARATGVVRVAVVPPGDPQAPVAVPDDITVEPGRVALVDVRANDLVAPGDRAEIELVQPPDGVEQVAGSSQVRARAPQGVGRTLQVRYRLTNGIESSEGTLTVRTARPFNNPPVVFDAFGEATDSLRVSVDVLATAYDPDGPSSALRVTGVYAAPGVQHSVAGGEVTVARGPEPRVVAYRVTDADGGSALAHLYIPPTGTGLPYLRPDALITVPSGGRIRAQLSDYLIDPSGRGVRFTPTNQASASPAGRLNVVTSGTEGLSVQAAAAYAGPGAVAVEVTNRAGDPGAQRTVVSIPAQVGTTAPILRCPTEAIVVPRDQTIELDVTALCHTWTADPEQADGLVYQADWERSSPGLSIIEPEGRVITVRAAGDGSPGAQGVLTVRSGRSEPGRIRLVVGAAGAPTMSPVSVTGMKAGESRVVDLAGYLRSSLRSPTPTVVDVSGLGADEVTVSPAGGSQVRIVTGPGASGLAQFRVTMSDTASGGPARQASNLLSVDVLGVPSAPTAPIPSRQTLSGQIRLTWRAPDANGAPIDRYEVRSSTGRTYRCVSTACDIDGLTNGTSYTFSVRAHNAVGWSEFGPRSRSATPDARPGPVSNIHMVKQGDTTVDIAWRPPTTRTSDIDFYLVTWADGGRAKAPGPYLHVTNLKNTRQYRFTVVAVNRVGPGEPATSELIQPQGDPEAPSRPRIQVGPPSGNTVDLTLTWNRVDPHGPGLVTYDVLDSGLLLESCRGLIEPVCVAPGVRLDGSIHSYAVRAVVGKGNTSVGPAADWRAVLPPAEWGDWTLKPKGTATDALASFTVPDAHGDLSEVTVYVDGHETDRFRATGQLTDKTLTITDNDRPHDVRLRLCNEVPLCTDSAVKTVQTWGGLRATMITLTPHHDSPTSLSWTVEIDSNGAAARVTIESDYRSEGPFTTSEPNITTYELGAVELGWDVTEVLRVTLDDPVRNRGPVTDSQSARTDQQPPAAVAVRKGPACSDSPGSDTPCNVDGQGQSCTDDSCAFIRLVTSNFGSPVECRVDTQDWSQPVDLAPIPDDASTVTALYFGNPGRWVKATCTDQATRRRDASDQLDW